MAFHPDGSLLATTGLDGTVRLWDVATRAPVAVLRGHTDSVWRVAFSADGKLLASCSSDKTIRLWDTQTHEPLAVIPVGSIVYSVAFSPDGTRLAAGCRDNTIRLIDVAQPPASRRAARPHRLRPRRRLEPGRHPAGLRLRRLHGARLGFAVGPGAGQASGRQTHAALTRRCRKNCGSVAHVGHHRLSDPPYNQTQKSCV